MAGMSHAAKCKKRQPESVYLWGSRYIGTDNMAHWCWRPSLLAHCAPQTMVCIHCTYITIHNTI